MEQEGRSFSGPGTGMQGTASARALQVWVGRQHPGRFHPTTRALGPSEKLEPRLTAAVPTCDRECGTGGLGSTSATILARILTEQVPQHQLCSAALQPRLPAPVSLQLQATLAPDHGDIRD